MGWYVTCEICGKEEKYGLGCDCYAKEAETLMKKRKGCIIEDNFTNGDSCEYFLYEALIPKNGNSSDIFYLRICIGDGDGEYACFRTVQQITKEEFLEAKINEENEEKQQNGENEEKQQNEENKEKQQNGENEEKQQNGENEENGESSGEEDYEVTEEEVIRRRVEEIKKIDKCLDNIRINLIY